MTGIEKTVTNRSGAGGFWCSVPYFFACAPVRKMLPIRQESGTAVRTSTGWHVPMLPVSPLATKDISVEVTTGKQPVWPIPGSMTSTMTGGTQRADMPGTVRNAATGFSVGSKGYVTTGYNPDQKYLADTWEYDPETNTWRQMDELQRGSPLLCPWVWH